MNVTIDSSVIVASLREQEPAHGKSRAFLRQVIEGKHTAHESAIVVVEVTAAIRRRTGSSELARKVRQNLLKLPSFIFHELTESRMNSAARIGEQVSLRGMDSIIAQISQEKESPLVTLDKEFAKKAKQIVTVKDVDRFL